ncbi:MAG: hypothetical protein D6772_11185, partial [Bacteroidetes bacterium]
MRVKDSQVVDLDRVANLLSKPPGWMLYWGNTLVLALLVLLIGMAAFIQYPDVVHASVRLRTEPAPLRQSALQDGLIAHLFLPEDRQVEQGDPLLVLESTAQWEDIIRLGQFLDTLSHLQRPVDVPGLEWEEQLELGELRPTYARLLNHLSELQY